MSTAPLSSHPVTQERKKNVSGMSNFVSYMSGEAHLSMCSKESLFCFLAQLVCLSCEYISWRLASPPSLPLHSTVGRQLRQTLEELLTLTGSDEAVQADVFLFALGQTASLTLSWLILELGLSQRQCLCLSLHMLSLQEGRACNYPSTLLLGFSLGVMLIP